MVKTYKQKYEELKKQSELKKHEQKYIHISWNSVKMFMILISLTILTYINTKLIETSLLEITQGFQQYIIIYPIIMELILISLLIITLVAMVKGGYHKLKTYEEVGLITCLSVGLIAGLAAGLLMGLIAGLIPGLIAVLIFGLPIGLIFGLIPEFMD